MNGWTIFGHAVVTVGCLVFAGIAVYFGAFMSMAADETPKFLNMGQIIAVILLIVAIGNWWV